MKYPKVAGYELVQQIGGGSFSTVFRAVNIEKHTVAACKVIHISENTTEKERTSVDKEIRIHTVLKHRNVLEFLHAIVVDLKYKDKYVPGIYMVLELAAGGDLFDKIAPDVGVSEDIAHFYFMQLSSGMAYIHSEGVCHRDLKPENLLLDAAGTLKISDFGLSAVFKLKESGKTRNLSERCGSLPYVAPELNYDKPYEAEPIDAWGMGVILFTMLAGNTPWDEPSKRSPEFQRYLSGEIFNEDPWNRLSEGPLSLICGLLTVDPTKRTTISEIFVHPWCMRPSQIAKRGAVALAEELTESLRKAGDLEYAEPTFIKKDSDGDDVMASMPAHQSQFTQSLLLFSQTQSGRRYTPHLTRFYTSVPPSDMIGHIKAAFDALDVKWKDAPVVADPRPDADPDETITEDNQDLQTTRFRLRVGGYDRRNIMFKGWVELEPFSWREQEGCFCVMTRDVGNPISWRQLWKAVLKSPGVEPYVLRK
ncbi:CAMK CAMKL CHK1 protein kinase [Coniophora puteana RWD-64-598 SS2]|uniref:non-specific serine/threonine protein kinase n=1 Tax=Coniophora puteana (strain RWD-64-598) TaxID=741705 RepID=A0A5M3N3H0_CONPW|nr:CAMK CAMKL CHK1 protein kinase [Coniophora puteana RWD-64-598 SS2]EIW85898.1 CAMK CAMKL CHK1 protein kinase [Coniophora puteana RWD-64-598 SS2]